MMKRACERCQKHLVAYIHQELSVQQRQRIARHLDVCESCYRSYLEHVDLTRQLTERVPRVGQTYHLSVERVWAALEYDGVHPGRTFRRYSPGYGLVALIAALMLFIPLTLENQTIALSSPVMQPLAIALRATPSSTESAEASALQISLTPGPEGQNQFIIVPSPDAITTP